MTIHRFHVPRVGPGVVELTEAAYGHVTRVLRLVAGDVIRVFDDGREFEAKISAIEKRRALIEVGAPVPTLAERAVPLQLIMSPLKGDLTEMVIQRATELGVARITPALFERTDTVARRDPGENRFERWRRVAVSAAEQSGRAVVPQLDTVVSLREATFSLGLVKDDEERIVATEPSIEVSNGRSLAPKSVRRLIVAVGPAGGLATSDFAILTAAAFVAERFAPHTLRSETACIAALAILGARHP